MKILKKQLTIHYQQCDIQKVCFEILDLFEVQIKGKELVCKIDIDQSCPQTIEMDAKKYQQVLLNIVQNAIKFTNQGGFEIILRFSQNEECKNKKCGILKTSVKDTGIGMNESVKKQLFQIFGNLKRVSEESIIKTRGIGLGLSICKELVNFQGGQINCDSEEGIGTTFTFDVLSKCEDCILQEELKREIQIHLQDFESNQAISQQDVQIEVQKTDEQFPLTQHAKTHFTDISIKKLITQFDQNLNFKSDWHQKENSRRKTLSKRIYFSDQENVQELKTLAMLKLESQKQNELEFMSSQLRNSSYQNMKQNQSSVSNSMVISQPQINLVKQKPQFSGYQENQYDQHHITKLCQIKLVNIIHCQIKKDIATQIKLIEIKAFRLKQVLKDQIFLDQQM
eukprot:403344450